MPLPLEADDANMAIFDPAHSCRLKVGDEVLGYVGQLAADARGQFDLRGPATVAEIRLRAAGRPRPSWSRDTCRNRPIRP